MELKCIKGHIGFDGVRYSIDDVLETSESKVFEPLMRNGFAIDVSKTPKPIPKPMEKPARTAKKTMSTKKVV